MSGIRINRLGRRAAQIVSIAALVQGANARPTTQSNAFLYQGLLKSGGAPVNGSVDLQFKLFDAASAGTQVGSPLAANAVIVANGAFTTSLSFGPAAFNGEERWLEVAVDDTPQGGAGPFTTLAPRQKLASTPYAAFALNALLPASYGSAVNFSNAGNAFTGSHSGSGSGLTNLNPSALAAGTAGINITGSAATATTATTAGNVSGVVGIANGGTNANNAATARTNLGAAALSHTHAAADIASGNLATARMPTGGAWSLSSALNLDADAFVVNPSNNSVGVGTAAPEAPLHVFESSAGTLTANSNSIAVFERSTGGFLSVLGPFGQSKGILFGHENDAASGGIVYDQSSVGLEAMQFRTGGNLTRMTIDFAGDVGIGTTNPTAKLHVAGSSGDGSVILPNNAIGVDELEAEPGLASDRVDSYTTLNNGDIVTVAGRSITCPDDGYLLALVTIEADGPAFGEAKGLVNVSNSAGTLPSANDHAFTVDIDPQTVTFQSLVAVTQGSHTFHVVVLSLSDGLSIGHRKLTLMYFPTSYGAVDLD